MRLKRKNVERVVETAEQAAKLKSAGYKEIGGVSPAPPGHEAPGMALEELTVAQLRELAKEKGLEGCGSLSKAELVSVLKGVV